MIIQKGSGIRKALWPVATFCACLLVLLNSCDPGRIVEGPKGRGEVYFPLSEGRSWVYRVDSIVFDDFRRQIDTHQYRIRYEIIDSINEGGRWAHRTARSIKLEGSQEWRFLEDLYLYRDDYWAVEKRDNVMDVKLCFPLALYKSWDGNLFNLREEEPFEIITLHEPLVLDGSAYNSTLEVLRRDVSNALQRSYSVEIYQKDIGLIKRRDIEKRSDQIGQEIPKGYELTYTLEEYRP